ncbi:MAG: hypothetical protein JWP01_2358 [Myxococcales bacterium]|nr:hypothetical protein [Myxococcales bacterium]
MRLVTGLLALALTGSLAYAEEPNAPEAQADPSRGRVRLRVVKVLPESHQALLYDKDRGVHVLAEVGSAVGGYIVQSIIDDEVTLFGAGRELVLAAPEPAWRSRRDAREARATRTAAAAPPDLPVDPYDPAVPARVQDEPLSPYDAVMADGSRVAPARAGSEQLVDPYAEPPVRIVTAPRAVPAPPVIHAGDDGVRVARAPSAPRAGEEIGDAYADAYGDAVIGDERIPAPRPTRAAPRPAPTDDNLYAPGIREFADAVAATGTEDPYADVPGVPAVSSPAPAASPEGVLLARRDVTAVLADFELLTRSLRGTFTPWGARLDMVAPGSVFAKAGLRTGDVVTAVDGRPLRSIDDAADLYVGASSIRSTTVQVTRAGAPITLRIALR